MPTKARNPELERYRRYRSRQEEIRFGPTYLAAKMAVRGEAAARSGAGTLPAVRLGRPIHAQSRPEKIAAALALYSGVFELHDQHLYYPMSMLHPLAYHPLYSHLPWPSSDGTFDLAEMLGLQKWHPRAWDSQADAPDADAGLQGGGWYIGAWVGDFLLYRRDAGGRPFILFWEVKDKPESHGRPGGDYRRQHSAKAIEATNARNTVCAAYAEQLASRIVEFSSSSLPYQLGTTLVSLCRNQTADLDLPDTAIVELVQAFREAVGSDQPACEVARKLVRTGAQFAAAKDLLDIAVWERRVRIDLYQPVLWNRPLLPESSDVLVDFAHLLAP